MYRLKVERIKKGLSQSELARRAHVHPSVISRLERGVLPPYEGWQKRIAKALGWSTKRAEELFKEYTENRLEGDNDECQKVSPA